MVPVSAQKAPRGEYFDAADGLRLYAEHTEPRGEPRGGVLLVHGYAEHCGRYRELADHLAGTGLHALAFDYRGHGRAGGLRGHCQRFDEFLSDFDGAAALLRRRIGDLPMAVVAHSHGSLVTLRILCEPGRLPAGIVGAALSSPFLALAKDPPALKATVGKLMSRVLPRLTLPSGLSIDDLTHDEDKLAERRSDTLCHDVASARWFTEALAAQAYVKKHARQISLPTLWLVAGADRLVDPKAAQDVFARAGGQKHLRVYDGLFHEVFNEIRRQQVYADLTTWLSKVLPAS